MHSLYYDYFSIAQTQTDTHSKPKYDRVMKSDVRCRFVIDMNSQKQNI